MRVSARAFSATVLIFAALSFAARAAAQTPASPPKPAVAEADTGYVTYDEGPVSLPLGVGLRIPRYDRVDGIALPWGPMITLGYGRFELDPTVTYRSHLGKFDPYGKGTLRLSPHNALTV
ncbi:MAG TPA: hypothetical protein VFC35_05615, partial [Gemmatimonadaceae bacterium]|nr:hypothetical protein [Gemmatimonadaceae bacterium]